MKKVILMVFFFLFLLAGISQAQPTLDSNAYANSLAGAWAGGGGGGDASISGLNFGMTFNSHSSPYGGAFRQHRIGGQLSYPMGPGYGGPWGQAHNFGVPVLLKTFSLGQLKRMGYSWWHTTSNSKFPVTRPYTQCRIDLVVLPSQIKDNVLIIPQMDFSEKQLIGWVNDRATSDKADSLDVLVRGMLEAMEAGADKLIVWQHNITFKQTGSNKGAAIQIGTSVLNQSEQTRAFSGDFVLGASTTEIGPDVRPFIKAIAIEEGPHVECVNDGDPIPNPPKKVEVAKPTEDSNAKLKKAAEDFLQELNKNQK
jgi:hypothetical protein